MKVIIKPIVTEKMTQQTESLNDYGFIVNKTANKIQIKKVTFTLDKPANINDNEIDTLKILSTNKNEIIFSYEKNKIKIEEIINLIKKKNFKILDISTDDGDLEDVFLGITKN